MKSLQLALIPAPSLSFGGRSPKGKRKTYRPMDTKRPMHMVLKSSLASGEWSLLHPRNLKTVRALVDRAEKRFQVQVLNFANVGNHLHLLVKGKTRRGLQGFMRVVAGGIAMKVTGAKKGNGFRARGDKFQRKFWDHLVFTRVVSWGKDLMNAQIYFTKNLFQGEGVEMLTPKGIRRFRVGGSGFFQRARSGPT